jgi:hypothetical protein
MDTALPGTPSFSDQADADTATDAYARRFSGPVGEWFLDVQRRIVTGGGEPVRLTPTEYDLLKALATHPDKVLTHRVLLQLVWGGELGTDSHYLHVYMGQLRRKIERDPSREPRGAALASPKDQCCGESGGGERRRDAELNAGLVIDPDEVAQGVLAEGRNLLHRDECVPERAPVATRHHTRTRRLPRSISRSRPRARSRFSLHAHTNRFLRHRQRPQRRRARCSR